MLSQATLPDRALAIVSTTIEHAVPVVYPLTSDLDAIGTAEDNAIVLAGASVAPHHLAVHRIQHRDYVVINLGRKTCEPVWHTVQPGDAYACPRHGDLTQLDARGWCPQCKRKRGSLWLIRPLNPGDTFEIGTAFRAEYIVQENSRHDPIALPLNAPAIVTHALPIDDPNLWRWQPEGVPFPIFMHQRVNLATTQHARQNREREVGGVLLGEVRHDERGQMYVVVAHAIKAEFADETRGHLTFTRKTWLNIHALREQHYPTEEIVGWYHTHPGWTIFLSPWDLFIHQNFFRQPWQIALVIDPALDRAGFFVWKDNQVNQPHAPIAPFRLAELDGWAEASQPRARIKLI